MDSDGFWVSIVTAVSTLIVTSPAIILALRATKKVEGVKQAAEATKVATIGIAEEQKVIGKKVDGQFTSMVERLDRSIAKTEALEKLVVQLTGAPSDSVKTAKAVTKANIANGNHAEDGSAASSSPPDGGPTS